MMSVKNIRKFGILSSVATRALKLDNETRVLSQAFANVNKRHFTNTIFKCERSKTLSPFDLGSRNVFNDLFSELDHFPFLNGKNLSQFNYKIMPIDVRETDKGYLIDVDLPGYGKENIKVSARDGIIAINAERKTTKEENKDSYRREERISGAVQRSFALPSDADDTKIEAKYEHGVLTLVVGKHETANENQARNIEVK